jgi:tRNA (cytidine/uridine-2'-O-)-methyltransferase
MHVVLVNPEIPPNTGNVIRLCANTGTTLHLVEPLGFRLDDAQLRRAGLDYHEYVNIEVHKSWTETQEWLADRRTFAFTSRGTNRHDQVDYEPDDVLVFGCESTGLPEQILKWFTPRRTVRLPMFPSNRSINLSNSVAVAVYEAWRQQGFPGAAGPAETDV